MKAASRSDMIELLWEGKSCRTLISLLRCVVDCQLNKEETLQLVVSSLRDSLMVTDMERSELQTNARSARTAQRPFSPVSLLRSTTPRTSVTSATTRLVRSRNTFMPETTRPIETTPCVVVGIATRTIRKRIVCWGTHSVAAISCLTKTAIVFAKSAGASGEKGCISLKNVRARHIASVATC